MSASCTISSPCLPHPEWSRAQEVNTKARSWSWQSSTEWFHKVLFQKIFKEDSRLNFIVQVAADQNWEPPKQGQRLHFFQGKQTGWEVLGLVGSDRYTNLWKQLHRCSVFFKPHIWKTLVTHLNTFQAVLSWLTLVAQHQTAAGVACSCCPANKLSSLLNSANGHQSAKEAKQNPFSKGWRTYKQDIDLFDSKK